MNVGQVAAAVGLLTPNGRMRAGYRSYDEADLRRLQQVLTYRELGFALDEVRALLDDPAVDVLDYLRRQQELLADRTSRGTGAYAQCKARTSSYDTSDWLRVRVEALEVERRFADAMLAGRAADDPSVTALAEDHRQQISRNYYDCDESMHRVLADLYVSDERLAAHYDAVAPGLRSTSTTPCTPTRAAEGCVPSFRRSTSGPGPVPQPIMRGCS